MIWGTRVLFTRAEACAGERQGQNEQRNAG